jgi:hypothetical protein
MVSLRHRPPYRCPRPARAPRRALPSGSRRVRGRVLHAGRVEGRAPALLVVSRELEVAPWCAIPRSMSPIPLQESSQNLSARSARSYEGRGSPANPSTATRSRPRWSLMDLWGADAHRLGKRWPRAACLGEALQDLLAPRTELERDLAIEFDSLELKRERRRVALRPPRIGQVLLRRVRDGARPRGTGRTRRRLSLAGESSRMAHATGSTAGALTAPSARSASSRRREYATRCGMSQSLVADQLATRSLGPPGAGSISGSLPPASWPF